MSTLSEHGNEYSRGEVLSPSGKPPYVTELYAVKPGTYVRMEAALWAGRWWWILALALLTLLILGVKVNAAFFYVALMLVFIIIPSLMMFFYFTNLLGEVSRIAMAEKKLLIDESGITVDFASVPVGDGPLFRRLPERHLPWTQIKTAATTSKGVMFHLRGGRYKILPLPVEAILDGTDPQELLEYALSCINDK